MGEKSYTNSAVGSRSPGQALVFCGFVQAALPFDLREGGADLVRRQNNAPVESLSPKAQVDFNPLPDLVRLPVLVLLELLQVVFDFLGRQSQVEWGADEL